MPRHSRILGLSFAVLAALMPFSYARADIEESKSDLMHLSQPVSDVELDKNRGAFDTPLLNISNLTAASTGNSVVGGVTGSNFITSSAFNNSSGIVSIIQNTGNNVIIQSSTIVNASFNNR